MRPLSLSMQAFGPFANKECIDFSVIDGRSLFLIHGNTGSGKTTILDAITFALYGVVSGNNRQAINMRSDFADNTVPTEVTFTFSLGTSIYKVYRFPTQELGKLRGEGTTKKNGNATLWEITDTQQEIVLENGSSDVTRKIETLLGFKSNQFCQVVILPQGEFLRLLTAKSEERQSILACLFKTDRYKLFELALQEASKKIEQEYNQIVSEKSLHLRDCDVGSIEELDIMVQSMTVELDQCRAHYALLRKEEDSLLSTIARVTSDNEKFAELRDAQTTLEKLQNEKNSINELEQRIVKIQKALQFKPAFERCEHSTNEITKLTQLIDSRKKNRDIIALKKNETANALHTCEQSLQTRGALNLEISLLKQIAPGIASLDTTIQQLSDVTQQKQTCANLLTEKTKHFEVIKTSLEKVNSEILSLKEQIIQKEVFEKRVEDLGRFVKESDNLILLKATRLTINQNFNIVEKNIRELTIHRDETIQAIDSLIALKEHYQIASIARSLVNGKPCPVCGSPEHPSPAATDSESPDESKLASLKNNLKKIDEQLEKSRSEHTGISVQLAKCDQSIVNGEATLLQASSSDGTRLKSLLKQSIEKLSEITELENRYQKRLNDKTRGDKAIENAASELEATRSNFDKLNIEQVQLQTMIKSIEDTIPVEYRTVRNIDTLRKEKELQLVNIEQAYQEALKNNQEVHEQQLRINAELDQHQKLYSELNTTLQLHEEEFNTILLQNGFRDRDDFVACVKQSDILDNVKQQITDFKIQFASAEQRVISAIKACSNLTPSDLKDLEQQRKSLSDRIESIAQQTASLEQRIKTLAKKRSEIAKLDMLIAAKSNAWTTSSSLSSIASGSNPLRITFERYILSSLLDEVLYAGTLRLKIMSHGRFELFRSTVIEDKRSHGGLNLEVFDSYTGTKRPVTTLSGGESFLAALSLALGLADIVQSYAGGIRLETIFIDEGFGSLDSEALDLALKTLSDLGQGGRLVGIISHVTELRERIETRLEVITGKSGSSTQFII
ncbi:MAG: AAA family ATPase [Fibrobacter sp.]|nr:AAA family ATPase [Fibrobacter sp.]